MLEAQAGEFLWCAGGPMKKGLPPKGQAHQLFR